MRITGPRLALVAGAAIVCGVTVALVVYTTLVAAVAFLLIAAVIALLLKKLSRPRANE